MVRTTSGNGLRTGCNQRPLYSASARLLPPEARSVPPGRPAENLDSFRRRGIFTEREPGTDTTPRAAARAHWRSAAGADPVPWRPDNARRLVRPLASFPARTRGG
jgi:hypothetical protein